MATAKNNLPAMGKCPQSFSRARQDSIRFMVVNYIEQPLVEGVRLFQRNESTPVPKRSDLFT